MKYLIIFFTILTAVCKSYGQSNPIIFTEVIRGGDHVYNLIIGSDKTEVNKIYNHIDGDQFHKDLHIRKYVISEKAINHIFDYIRRHCIPSDSKPPVAPNSIISVKKTNTKIAAWGQGNKRYYILQR